MVLTEPSDLPLPGKLPILYVRPETQSRIEIFVNFQSITVVFLHLMCFSVINSWRNYLISILSGWVFVEFTDKPVCDGFIL